MISEPSSFLYQEESLQIAVCGLHMRGYPLEKQLLAHGAHFIREDKTAPVYRFYLLRTMPLKPGLIRTSVNGASISLEVWEIPVKGLGSFTALIPSPLVIGKVQLQSGEEICGFICEGYAAENAEDITEYGSWRKRFPLDSK